MCDTQANPDFFSLAELQREIFHGLPEQEASCHSVPWGYFVDYLSRNGFIADIPYPLREILSPDGIQVDPLLFKRIDLHLGPFSKLSVAPAAGFWTFPELARLYSQG